MGGLPLGRAVQIIAHPYGLLTLSEPRGEPKGVATLRVQEGKQVAHRAVFLWDGTPRPAER